MWLNNGTGRSQTKGHVKGGTSSDTAFGFQAVHYLKNYLISDLYPRHFDHDFFFYEQQVTACVSILKSVLSFSLLYREMEFPVVLSV